MTKESPLSSFEKRAPVSYPLSAGIRGPELVGP